MRKCLKIFSVLLIFTSPLSFAQQRFGSDLPKETKRTPEYQLAEGLISEALDKLSLGETNSADSLVYKAIDIYPVTKVYEYAKELAKLSNVSTANSIMDYLHNKVRSSEDDRVIVADISRLANTPFTVRKYPKNRGLMRLYNRAYMINREFGGILRSVKNQREMAALNISKKDGEYSFKLEAEINVALFEKNYEKAFELSNHSVVDDFKIYIEKGDYAKALDLFPGKVGGVHVNKLLFKAHTLLGNIAQAKILYEDIATPRTNYFGVISQQSAPLKTNEFTMTPDMYYYQGINNLTEKKYTEALENFSKAQHNNNMWSEYEAVFTDQYKIYKLIGDAYVGLQQYEKAKDNYNLSLLHFAEYEPAETALAKLESIVATTTATDKTAPVITITEPAVQRGFEIVSAANDIMVKGNAADPSGLKAVTVNGISIYAQPGGAFWGSVALKDGLNKIIVKATDGAGNVSEQSFDISKNATASEIVPAIVKEGKNYCLLIGAQNYSDLNIPSLENPIQDAVRLKLLLKRDYNFDESNIITLFNPSADDVRRQLLEFTNTIQPEDNLLIFYAGHGTWSEKEKKGYWLLVDAKRNDPNTWLQNKDVLNLIAKLPSRHTLLITDACFSGGVFKTRSIGKDAPVAIQSMNEKISRVAITSGNDTEVPDESVFMKYLIKALSENKDKYLAAQKMFITQIMEAVMTETKTEPRYGTLELAGHVGGDFIFAKK